MVLNVHRNRKAYYGGGGVGMLGGGGGGEIIDLSLHCHHHNDSLIKSGQRAMRAILMFREL